MNEKRPLMILAHSHVSEESPVPAAPAAQAEPVIQRRLDPEAGRADPGTPAIDIFRVAERVYQLMREDLAVERIRRGLGKS